MLLRPLWPQGRPPAVVTGSGGAATTFTGVDDAFARSMNPVASVSRSCFAFRSVNAGSLSSVSTSEKRFTASSFCFSL